MGTADFACPSLATLDDSPLTEVLAVVTQPDRPRGRKLIPRPPAVKVEAQRRNMPIHQPERLRDDFEFLTGLAPDLIVVAAYGQILSQPVLSLPEHGCINVHGSLLPLYRGAAPIQRAILDGHTETGVTIMEMEAGLDTGAMISKVRTPIEPADNAQTLHDRLAKLGATLLIETIPGYVSGEITPEPQDDSQATHAAKITRDMGRVDWSKTATEIWNQARAFTPWPGVFTHLNGKLLKLLEVEPSDATGLAPGALGQSDADGILVGCGGGALRIKRLQKEGGKRLAADAFLAGNPLRQAPYSVKLPAGTVLG